MSCCSFYSLLSSKHNINKYLHELLQLLLFAIKQTQH